MFHDWCNKCRGMWYPVCGMVHIKEPLLLIGKSSLCGGSGFPFSLSECSITICLTPYNRKYNVLSASLNKTFPSLATLKTNPYQIDNQTTLAISLTSHTHSHTHTHTHTPHPHPLSLSLSLFLSVEQLRLFRKLYFKCLE